MSKHRKRRNWEGGELSQRKIKEKRFSKEMREFALTSRTAGLLCENENSCSFVAITFATNANDAL